MADDPEPTADQVKASVADAIRKLTGSDPAPPEAPPEGTDDTASPTPPAPEPQPA